MKYYFLVDVGGIYIKYVLLIVRVKFVFENKVKIEEAFSKTLNNYKTKLETDYSNKEWIIPTLFSEDPNYCFRIEGEGIQEYYKVYFLNL